MMKSANCRAPLQRMSHTLQSLIGQLKSAADELPPDRAKSPRQSRPVGTAPKPAGQLDLEETAARMEELGPDGSPQRRGNRRRPVAWPARPPAV